MNVLVKAKVHEIEIDIRSNTLIGMYQYGDTPSKLLIISGLRGDEGSSIFASYHLMKLLDAVDSLSGTVSIIPVANPLAFRLGTPASPIDHLLLDNEFPGRKDGTISQRVAWELWNIAKDYDYVITLHSSLSNSVLFGRCMYEDNPSMKDIFSSMNLPYIVHDAGEPGKLFVEVSRYGIPSLDIVIPGNGSIIEPRASMKVVDILLEFLSSNGWLTKSEVQYSPSFLGPTTKIIAPTEGFFIPAKEPGEKILENESIGAIEGAGELTVPISGLILSVNYSRYVFKGDFIAEIALHESKPAVRRSPIRIKEGI